MYKSHESRITRTLKNHQSAIKMKSVEGYSRKEEGDALWNYVGINSCLYGCEVSSITKGGLKKLESINCEMGRWLLKVNRGIPNVAIQGELGWTDIYTKIAIRKLEYAERVQNMYKDNWVRKQCWQVSTVHGKNHGKNPVITDTVEILSTVVKRVETVETQFCENFTIN